MVTLKNESLLVDSAEEQGASLVTDEGQGKYQKAESSKKSRKIEARL